MANELDDIKAQVDCPKCGKELNVPYRVIRLQKTVGCSCDAIIRLVDDTPIGVLQRLIDEENPPTAENDR
ncbi:hypothetical protein A8G00_10390 [Sphingobium sp. SA916]|jgi:hypothetical protein|nr:hypothetical protein A8G00_10390 [Sphingobium sp. SA916]